MIIDHTNALRGGDLKKCTERGGASRDVSPPIACIRDGRCANICFQNGLKLLNDCNASIVMAPRDSQYIPKVLSSLAAPTQNQFCHLLLVDVRPSNRTAESICIYNNNEKAFLCASAGSQRLSPKQSSNRSAYQVVRGTTMRQGGGGLLIKKTVTHYEPILVSCRLND